jgi:hypothetical protein
LGVLNVAPPSLDEAKKIGDWVYAPVQAPNRNRVQDT